MKHKEIASGISLVDFLAGKAGCMYVSDLRHLNEQQSLILFTELLKIPSSAADEKEWNEALEYIEHLPAQTSAEGARKRLLAALSEQNERKKEEDKT